MIIKATINEDWQSTRDQAKYFIVIISLSLLNNLLMMYCDPFYRFSFKLYNIAARCLSFTSEKMVV